MKKATLKQKFSYWFDNMMSRGTPAMIVMLFVASGFIILLVALIVAVFSAGPDGLSFGRLVWMSLMRTLDPGTMGGDEGNSFFLFMMLVVTIGGLFVVSALIGVINSGLETGGESGFLIWSVNGSRVNPAKKHGDVTHSGVVCLIHAAFGILAIRV